MTLETKRICPGPVVTLLVAIVTSVIVCRATQPGPATLPPQGALPALPSEPGSVWTRHTIGGGGGQTGIAIDPTNTRIAYVTTDNSGIVKTTDGGNTWFSINNNIGNGLLAGITMDPLNPNVLYVAAEVQAQRPSWNNDPVNGELYRTRDGGQTWEIVYAEGMGAGDKRCFGIVQWPSTRNILIPYDPSNPRRYDADGDGLSDVIYVGGWDGDETSADWRGGIWKSTDEGATFSQVALNDKKIWVLRQDPRNPQVLYAGTYGDGLFVSRDGGATWEDWRGRIPIPMISDVAIDPAHNMLYVATNAFHSEYRADEYRGRRGIYKSTDGGKQFVQVNLGLEKTDLNFEVLLLDKTDPSGQTLYAGSFRGNYLGIYKTSNGGAQWSLMPYEVANSPDWFADFSNAWGLDQAPDGTLFATTWRGIYRYNPARGQWEIKSNGLGNVDVQSVAFEPGNASTIYLGIGDSTPWKSIDAGATWVNIGDRFRTADGQREASARRLAVSPTRPQIVYATGTGPSGSYLSAVNKSEDGGAHWQPIVNGLPSTSSADPQWSANAIVVSLHDPDVAYVALDIKSGGGRIFKTMDGGDRWTEIYAMPESPTHLAISSTDPETVVCATLRGTIHIGKQGGSQWQSSDLHQGLIYGVDVFPSDPDRILVGVNVTGAFLTTDGGKSWQHVFDRKDVLPFTGTMALSDFARERYRPTIMAVRFDPRDPNTLYIGHNPFPWMGVGMLKSTDGGKSWISLADKGFQMRSVSDFDLDPASHNLVVGTWEVYYYHADRVDTRNQ